MATYLELANVRNDDQWNALRSKIGTACADKAARVIDSGTAPQAAKDWAAATLSRPIKAADDLATYVVVSNKTATMQQIYDASDSEIQINVDAAVDAIYGAL